MRIRTTFRWMTVAALAMTSLFATAAAPGTASAAPPADGVACPVVDLRPALCEPQWHRGIDRVAGLDKIGWTWLNLNYCAPGRACTMQYRDAMAGWSWGSAGWQPAALRQGWVYVYPYAGTWRWGWTAETGWVAVQGGRFELRSYATSAAL